MYRGLTPRALFIALLLSVVTGFWIRQSEIVVLATQVSESVPTIPSLAALVVLLAGNALWRRLPNARPLTRAEMLTIFLFVATASMVMGIGVVQFLIALLVVPFYRADGVDLRPHFPAWLMPTDLDAIKAVYERSPDGVVPWNLWVLPGVVWCGFLLAVAVTLMSVMSLFFRSWAEEERLAFPLLILPLEMAEESGSFWRNKTMWGGFSIAAAYNGVNIAHALNPTWPEIGKKIDLNPFLAVAPWDAAQSVALHLRPELMGLGYLVSTDVSLSLWLTQIVIKLGAVFAAGRGYEPHGLYPMEQGFGAYIALAGVLIYLARRGLRRAWTEQPKAVLGLCAGFAAMTVFAVAAGMALWVTLVYFVLVVAIALVYGRLRAQTGVPMVWLFPYYQQKQAMFFTLGSLPFAHAGPPTVAVFTLFTLLSRGYFPSICGYQVEGFEVARREGFRRREMAIALLLAVVVGFALGWYHHLTPYYRYGALHLRGDIWGEWIASQEVSQAASIVHGNIVPPDNNKMAASVLGAVVVLALTLARMRFAGFALSPFGYAMSCCFGETMWFSFFVVWMVKTLVLRYGGMMLYRRTVPFFLGLALGHFAVAGVFWGLVGAFSGEAVQGYPVYFG